MKSLNKKIAKMMKDDWMGKKGLWTDNEMFKYCKWYTGKKLTKPQQDKLVAKANRLIFELQSLLDQMTDKLKKAL